MAEEKEPTNIKVDADTCIGCGTCEGIAPDFFKVIDGVAHPLKSFEPGEEEEIEETIDSCPVQAISIAKAKEQKQK